MSSTTTDVRRARPRIIIVRHGQPVLDRNARPRLSWQEYVGWWQRYEASSLKPGQTPPPALVAATARAPFLLASIRPRAIETARAIAGDREVRTDPIFVEAALPPPRWGRRRLLPKTWNKWARLWWYFGHSLEDEPKTAAKARARQAAQRLVATSEAEGQDVVLCAHGWFNRMLRPELARLGWRCVRDGGDSYWSFRVYERA